MLTLIWLSQIKRKWQIADPLDDVIVDKNGMCRWSDVVADRHTSGKAHEDRTHCVTSAAGVSGMPHEALRGRAGGKGEQAPGR